MRFILSSGLGFEIDSSEFATSLETSDVPRTVKAFIESPYIDEGCSFVGFTLFFETLELTKNQQERFERLMVKYVKEFYTECLSNKKEEL